MLLRTPCLTVADCATEVDDLDGHAFESILEKLFKNQGYTVKRQKLSNDQGADLILERFGHKVVVQAKRYAGTVPNTAIQEVHMAMTHYRCDEAWIVTQSNLTRPARQLADSSNIRIIARSELEKMIKEYL